MAVDAAKHPICMPSDLLRYEEVPGTRPGIKSAKCLLTCESTVMKVNEPKRDDLGKHQTPIDGVNGSKPGFETRQVLVGDADVWRALRSWARGCGLCLSEVSGWDPMPTYALGVTAAGFHGVTPGV